MNEANETKNLSKTKKRAWTSPKLIHFGDVKSLTQQPGKPASNIEDFEPETLRELVLS